MTRTAWMVFAAIQAAGEICLWTWPHSLSIGSSLWVGSFILLFPGDILGAWLVETFLWHSPMTLFQLQIVEMPLEITINAAIWLLVASLFGRARRLHWTRGI